jgi:16S rRNA (adenine1518-N6/adenine1519-N6)-dimethyltransferase
MGRYLGQHFLKTQSIIDTTIEQFSGLTCPIVEVGPGAMALTKPLLQKQNPLLLIERDSNLILNLEKALCDRPNSHLVHLDVLKYNFEDAYALFSTPFALLSNLPYLISTPFLEKMLHISHRVVLVHLLLQKEVVEKIAANRGPNSSRLSHLLNIFYEIHPGQIVGCEHFDPPPKVDSQFVTLVPRPHPLLDPIHFKIFEEKVRYIYNHRSHTLHWIGKKTDFAPFLGQNLTIDHFSTPELIQLMF